MVAIKSISSKRLYRPDQNISPKDGSNSDTTIGYFHIDEVKVGKLIDSTEEKFHVHDVRGFNLSGRVQMGHQKEFARNLMKQRVADKVEKYSVKFIANKDYRNSHESFEAAAFQLEKEATVMTLVNHKNIAKIRGTAMSGVEAYYESGTNDAYFIIVDQISESLSSKLEAWRKRSSHFQFRKPCFQNGNTNHSCLRERLKVGYSLADAIEHLHSRGIIHSKIHPRSIGFDHMDQVKLNGLGDAIIIAESGHKKVPRSRYSSRDRTATTASDVYSFSKLCCELLTLCTINKEGHPDNPTAYLDQCNYLSTKLPKELFECLLRGLSTDPDKRPSISEVKDCIDEALIRLEIQAEKGSEKRNFHGMLRSTLSFLT